MIRQPLGRVLIMAGGTGGHVFPGLAVARYLQQRGVVVEWLGTQKGLESRVIPEADIPFHTISIQGVRGKGKLSLLLAPLRIAKALYQACRIIYQVRPQVVLGLGGFVSGPGGVAAWLLRRPLVIHEQNACPGMTNRLLSHLATKVLEGFPNTFKPAGKVIFIGNPVRDEIEQLPCPKTQEATDKRPLHLLVLGGSLGAKVFNEMVPVVLAAMPASLRPKVWHQTGEKLFLETKNNYQSNGLDEKVTAFIEDMAAAYAWADLVLCRAGALTVSECCVAGKGAILVPYPHAVDDHQTMNASFMVNKGAAYCVQQSALTKDKLTAMLGKFGENKDQCLAMSQAAYGLRRVGVTAEIYAVLESVLPPMTAAVGAS